ncbi:MAG: DNA polymerase III subunit beta [Deltaproteobacteria bacterium]|jgi:DNA polymerase-3 subunit beta|nr:DNA polymerase III subunit beta [Deltaproteobacteria bacterium]
MLKATANIADLQKGLAQTSSIAGKFTSMPILANVRLDASGGRLTLTATDLEITFQASYDADVLEEGSFTVPAKALSDIAGSLSGNSATLEELENLVLKVKTDYFTADLLGISPDEFPKTADTGSVTYTEFPSAQVADAVSKTIYSVAVGNTNFNLAGIFWVKEPLEDGRETLKLVSTDNNRLNIATLAVDNLEAFLLDTGVLLSRKGLTELKNLAETADKISLGVNANNLVAKTENSLLIIRLLSGKFPNYQVLIPQQKGHSINLNRRDFTESLKRMSLISTGKFRVVYFQVNQDSLILTSSNPELGQAEEKIPVDYEGPVIDIGFDPRHLLEALGSLKSEIIQLELIDNSRPAVITGENDPGYTGIITTITPRDD